MTLNIEGPFTWLLHTLGLTVVHSLWQGALLAALCALFLRFSSHYSAQRRYTIGILTLLAMLGTSIATFFLLLFSTVHPEVFNIAQTLPVMAHSTPIPASSLLDTVSVFYHHHSVFIATVWLAGILLLSMRLAGGFILTRRLVSQAAPAHKDWQKQLQMLCQKLHLQKTVELLESTYVSSPLTIGHFKPIILFPLGLLTSLPGEQAYALLAHELAHILRHDYLLNIVQMMTDILYFHHPALRWVSAMVRQEREHCCDDLAVAVNGNPAHVAHALAQALAWAGERPALALSAAGPTHTLLNRIRRIMHMKHDKITMIERLTGSIAIALLLIAAGIGVQAATQKKPKPAPPAPEVLITPVLQPSIPYSVPPAAAQPTLNDSVSITTPPVPATPAQKSHMPESEAPIALAPPVAVTELAEAAEDAPPPITAADQIALLKAQINKLHAELRELEANPKKFMARREQAIRADEERIKLEMEKAKLEHTQYDRLRMEQELDKQKAQAELNEQKNMQMHKLQEEHFKQSEELNKQAAHLQLTQEQQLKQEKEVMARQLQIEKELVAKQTAQVQAEHALLQKKQQLSNRAQLIDAELSGIRFAMADLKVRQAELSAAEKTRLAKLDARAAELEKEKTNLN